jgi:hypothetical protein
MEGRGGGEAQGVNDPPKKNYFNSIKGLHSLLTLLERDLICWKLLKDKNILETHL